MSDRDQLKTHQLKCRQISLKYLKLEEAGQHLNFMVRFDAKKLHHKHLQLESIDPRQLFGLMVQTIYLLFTASVQEVNLKVSKQIYISRVTSQHFTIHKLYILDQHYFALNAALQQYVDTHFDNFCFSASNQVFQNNCFGLIHASLSEIQRYSQRYPDFLSKFYKPHFEQFCIVLNQFIRPNLGLITSQTKLVECLEKTEVFRDNSLLLNIKGFLVYDDVRNCIEEGELFDLLLQAQKQLSRDLQSSQNNRDAAKIVRRWIERILILLIQFKLIFSQLSRDEQGKDKTKEKMNKQQQEEIKQKWQIYTKERRPQEFTKDNFLSFMRQNPASFHRQPDKIDNRIIKKSNFIIQYDSNRQLVVLKMLTDMNITIENSDFLIYQTTVISEDWEIPCIELIDSTKKGDRRQKTISLCGCFKIMPSQHPSAQFLLLLDSLMIHSKVLAIELNKPPYKRDYPLQFNFSQTNLKRMNQLLISNIKKVYEIQLSESDEEQF